MILIKTRKAERRLVCALTLFNVFSAVYSAFIGNLLYVLSALAGTALVFAPYILEGFFRIRFSEDLKVMAMILVVGGPVLGNVYKLYHIVPFWDKAMHVLSGYAVAALGYALADLLEPVEGGHSRMLRCVFALGIAMSIGVLWEIYEYAVDVFFRLDLQNDTWISALSSYELGAETGEIGTIPRIESVTVNGAALPGYLDIGLIDTMNDLIACALGAVVLCVLAGLSRNTDFATVRLVS